MNIYFDKIFIINRDSRNDRWEQLQNNLIKLNITNYERISAIEPIYNQINKKHYRNFTMFFPIQYDIDLKTYITGSCGCKYSHIKVMKLAKKRGYKRILVLEDDAELLDNFEDVFFKAVEQLPDKWDIVQLCGNYPHEDPPKISKNLLKIGTSFTTLAYMVTDKLFDTIINDCNDYGQEVDVYYIEKIYSTNNSYCITPHIVKSMPSVSDILGKEVKYEFKE